MTDCFFKKIIIRTLVLTFGMLLARDGYSQFYVNDNSTSGDVFGAGLGNNANPGTLAAPFATIQFAINSVPIGSTIIVETGTYDEQVLVNKRVTIQGAGGVNSMVNFTGTVSGKPTLFDVSVDQVVIQDMAFNVDLSKLRSAIIASAAALDNITVNNNNINAYGTPAGSYGDRNAVSINYTGSTNYRVATGGVNSIIFNGNTVGGTGPGSYFRAALATDESGLSASNNTLQTINHDILSRFGSNGNISITNNNFNGGGVEVVEMNAGAGTLSITGNTFDGTGANVSAPGTAVLRLQNNYNSKSTTVSGNTFVNHQWAVNLSNYNSVTLNNNSFTPLAGSTTFHHVTINTKSISTNSALIVQVTNGATLTNNSFYGSGTPGGTAISFHNHDNNTGIFGTFTIGTSGNENNFNNGIANNVYLDNATGATNLLTFPAYTSLIGAGANAITTAACWTPNIDIQNNKFDVGAGLQLPTAMSGAQLATLETRVFHKPDASCLGIATYALPVHNLTQNTYYSTIQSAVTAANVNDVIECLNWTFNEKVTINKTLTLQGTSEAGSIIDGTGLGNGSGITVSNGITNVVIKYFTIQNHAGTSPNSYAGIYAVGGNNGINVQHCTIKNNIGGSGFYANGPINGVTLDDLDVSGHSNAFGAARGIVIWNGLKQNISITNCDVYNNNCCGIELQDGTASGVTMTNNNVHDNGDSGFGLIGLQGPGTNLISSNIVSNNGRFGIEVKNPNGNGASSGAGSVVVSGNTVSRTNPIGAEARDIAGISVYRRGVLAGNVDVPVGVYVSGNNVSGYTQPSTSDGFGIVVEGINHTVTGNTVTGNDVGIQRQAGHTPYPGDGNQNNLADLYFGRGNSPLTCGVSILSNTLSNTVDTRDVGSSTGGSATNQNTGAAFCTIQGAINDAATVNGHVISLTSGTFKEDVVVSKELEIKGQGVGQTTVQPSTSNPNTGGGSLGGTNVFLVQANNVKIHDMTIDGDNPSLTSAENVGGANIDARNGIITNHNLGVYTNLEVYNTEVKNIWLRGIYQSSGGTFNFHDNSVTNVQASSGSIAMFSFGSAGTYANNTVSFANDAIAANHSKGVNFTGNTVTNSGSGIHTDNSGDGGGVPDNITGNTVSNSTSGGYGIWVFVPYQNVLVQGNTVSNVDVGLTSAGFGAASTVTFQENHVDGQNKVGSTGVYATTNQFGFGSGNNVSNFINNYIINNETGFYLEADPGFTLNLTANDNSMSGNSLTNVDLAGTGTHNLNFQCNWWGVANGGTAVGEATNFTPWRTDGTDAAPASIGFQPVSACNPVCSLTPSITNNTGTTQLDCAITSISVTATGGVSYSWDGGLGNNANATITAPGTYTVTATGLNGCTGQTNIVITQSLTNLVGAATVSGLTNVCPFLGNNTPVTYTASAPNATSYNWVLPPNVNLQSGQGTATITVTFNAGFGTQANKQIRVTPANACGNGTQKIYYLLAQYPTTPAPIIASTSDVCPSLGTNVPITYTIPKVLAATSYIWTAQAGNTTITSVNGPGPNDTVVNVTFASGFSTSNITVQAVNSCGVSGTRSLTITRANPATPGLISGPTNVCAYRAPLGVAATYSVAVQPTVTQYNWTLPGGAINVTYSGATNNQVSFIYPASYTGGSISVSATNGCGTSTTSRSLSVATLSPATPSIIDVVNTVTCADPGPNRVFTYSLSGMPANATSVQWTVPAGATITSGQGTQSITVTYPSTSITGTVTATAVNNCGSSNIRSIAVKLATCPPEFASNTEILSKGKATTVETEEFSVQVFPNPSISHFSLKLKSADKTSLVTVRVLDVQGRELSRTVMAPEAVKLIGAELKAGTYMLEVIQGQNRNIQKLIRL